MSQISLKSISGITSITTPAGVDDVFSIHTSNTSEVFRIDQSGNQSISGIITATSFHASTGLHFTNNNGVIQTGSSGHMLGIQGGATNMGGRIELRGGNSTGDIRMYAQGATSTQVERLRITSNGKIGIGTASPTFAAGGGVHLQGGNEFTSFKVSAHTNTGVDFAQDASGNAYVYNRDNADLLLGTNNAQRVRINNSGAIGLGGANYGSSGQVLTSQGSGSAVTWSTISGTNIVNNASGRLVVGSNTANTLDAKSEATYNGTKLLLTGGVGQDQHIPMLELKHLNTAYSSGNGDGPALLLNGYYASNEWALAKIAAVNAGGQYGSGYGGGLQFWVHPANGTQTASVIKGAEIIGDGTGADLYITNGDIKFASGHGIDFSATSDSGGGTMSSEVLDDYEEGLWVPLIRNTSGSGTYGSSNVGSYTKIGNMVHISGTIHWTAMSGTTNWAGVIRNLPFASYSGTGYYRSACVVGATSGLTPNNSGSPHIVFIMDRAQGFLYIVGANVTGSGFTHYPTISNAGSIYGFDLSYRVA